MKIRGQYTKITWDDKFDLISTIKGNKIKISTSKIANTKATRKKCKEKDIRNSLSVGKPHSKGLCSSRSNNDFFLTSFPKAPKINPRPNTTSKDKNNT